MIGDRLKSLALELRALVDARTWDDLSMSGLLDGPAGHSDWTTADVATYLDLAIHTLRTNDIPLPPHDASVRDIEIVWESLSLVQYVRARQLVNMATAHTELRSIALSAARGAIRSAIAIANDDSAKPRDRLTAIRSLLEWAGMATPRRVEIDVTDRALDAQVVSAQIEETKMERMLAAARALGLPGLEVFDGQLVIDGTAEDVTQDSQAKPSADS